MKQIITTPIFFASSFMLAAQNVGIGESAPTAMKLQVKSADSAVLLIQNSSAAGSSIKTGMFYKTGSNFSGAIATIGGGSFFRMGFFTFGGASPSSLIERVSILDGGNVGIGTTNPTAKLELAGTFKVVDGKQSAGKVLTSDASGNATWVTPVTGGTAFTLPYSATVNSFGNLFQIQNTGVGSAIRALNSSSSNAALKAEASGGADAIEAISSGGGTVTALQNGAGIALQGLASANGTAGFFNSSSGYALVTNNGNVGIGNLAPTYKLDINGRGRLMHNGSSAGLWYSKADNTEAAFVGMFNDTTFGFFGGNGWSSGFDIKNNLLGVGVLNPTAPLSFPSNIGNKIALWGNAGGGHYGLGIQGSLMQIYSAASNADIAFGYGSSNAFTERMRIRGNGNVGIGASPFFGKLDVRELTNTNSTALYVGVNNSLSSNTALRVESISGTSGQAILAYRQGTGNALLASSTHGQVISVNGGDNPGDIGVKAYAGTGLWGLTTVGGGIGVRASNGGFASGTAFWAQGYSFTSGNLDVIGTLSKSAGSFKIDHPQDPQNKFLIHSFVESPDMMNVYNGNISTNKDGFATITLPSYFEALNIDFKYQLTILGKEFAQALVFEKIKNNQFIVRTDKPNTEVSWQITGVRNDKYAQQNRILPEVEKSAKQKGKYLNATEFGVGEEKQITPNDR